jgi:ATP-dependent DNA ligase
MLASTGTLPADSDKFAVEVKWDGYRALVDVTRAGVTVFSRNGYVVLLGALQAHREVERADVHTLAEVEAVRAMAMRARVEV